MSLAVLRRYFSWAAIVLWAIGLSIVTSTLMVGHWVVLPHPQVGTASPAVATFSAEGATPSWSVVHFLYHECPCSNRVLRRLVEREADPRVTELIVLIGSDVSYEEKVTSRGYQFDCVTPEELQAKYKVESAPLLIVSDRNGVIRYSGGYTSRKQGFDVQDVEIIDATIQGKSVENLPLYGCGVSRELQDLLDPLRLKY